ncbi:MAG: N-acetylmuramoyl-L-alanine amidase [Verrucomicrobia bacterium]|nr:N-acetylmuramoyl-L-alanine amidase [Verrucomicrobiota bacterium]
MSSNTCFRTVRAFMNLALALTWLMITSAAVAASPGSLAKLERVQLFGHEYVRLDDWAAANDFELKWLRKDELVQVKSKWSKLVFEVDSRRAEINGVTVWLSVVVARKNGGAYVSPVDLQTAIHPVLFPPRSAKDDRIKTICLDPGHGGKDPGNEEGGKLEKKFTLLLAQEVQKRLRDAGFRVVLTRTRDEFVELPDRPDFANNSRADLFVSLHFNSGPAGARGVETYCLTPAHMSSTNARGEGTGDGGHAANKFDEKNLLLAWQLQKSLVGALDAEDRGVKRARFAVLKAPQMPAVLIEGGFMTDKDEAKKIFDASYRQKMAKAIVDGVLAYKQQVER